MQIAEGKTARAFHATDDLPEVRREVFNTLLSHEDLRFYAVVRDKLSVLTEVRRYTKKRYHPNQLYDQLMGKLFDGRIHKDDEYDITFAIRGSSDRTRALEDALKLTRARFEARYNIHSDAPIHIIAYHAHENACLQATDYFLWALQRCYERREDRYLDYLWERFRMVYDMDDQRVKRGGVYYTKKTPLILSNLRPLEEI